MNLVLINLELSIEIIITNCNNQTKQENMHLFSTASSLNNHCQKTISFIFPWTSKIYFFEIRKTL